MAHAALLTEDDRGHAHLIRAFLRDEYCGMTIGAIEPLCVLPVRINDIGHRALDFAHDIQIKHRHFSLRVLLVRPQYNLFFIECLDPIDAITRITFGKPLVAMQRRLQ